RSIWEQCPFLLSSAGQPHVKNRDLRRALRHVPAGVERLRRRATWLRSHPHPQQGTTSHRFFPCGRPPDAQSISLKAADALGRESYRFYEIPFVVPSVE